MKLARMLVVVAVLAIVSAREAGAGGAWIPVPGEGDIQIGASRKTAHTSWDDTGRAFENTGRFQNHDFRYTYLSGEVGVARRFAMTFLVTYLDGREGPTGNLRRNVGFSDAWLGVKYALKEGSTPMALAFTVRTSALYDVEGPYSSELYDDDGSFIGHSPEWRGLLKEDYTVSYLTSRSLGGGSWWGNLEIGYTHRAGAPADQVPLRTEVGRWLPGTFPAAVKLGGIFVRSLGNDSPRQPDDRFGSRPGFNFNDASMGALGLSVILPFGPDRGWSVEAGYNLWVWGRSARQYEEPFLSVGRRF